MRKSEWVLITAAISAGLDWLVGFGFHGLSATSAAAIMAVITAVGTLVAAFATRPIAPSAFAGLIAAVAALGSAYGMHFSRQGVGFFTVFVLAVVAAVTRGQVSPKADAPHTGVLGQRRGDEVLQR